MNEKDARSLMMDYLYDEMDQQQKVNFEQTLHESPQLQKELNEMQQTRDVLRQLPTEEPSGQLMLLNPDSSRFTAWWNDAQQVFIPTSIAGRTLLAIAAALLIAFLLASIANLRISTSGDGFTIAFGSVVTAEQTGFTEEEVAVLLDQIQRENTLFATRLIEEAQKKQAEQFEEAMLHVVSYFEEQRMKDLRLVDSGIARLEEETYNRFRQTDETLGDLIYAITMQQE